MLKKISLGSRQVLLELEILLDKFRDFSNEPDRISGKLRRVWKRLKWEPEEVKELRSRITSNITLLNAFNEKIIGENTSKLVRYQDDQERRAILNWLSPLNNGSRLSDFLAKRHKGTGQWLLASHKFREWLSIKKRTLFCQGMPGAGKTIIVSTVIDYSLPDVNTG